MRWFTTLFLAILAGASAIWFWKGDAIAPQIGLAQLAPPPTPERTELEKSLGMTADGNFLPKISNGGIQVIELQVPGSSPVILEHERGGLSRMEPSWTQPGNWPVRQEAATQLEAVLSNLGSRFRPVPYTELEDYASGFAPEQNPIRVKITEDNKTTEFLFGQPNFGSTTNRPTFVRLAAPGAEKVQLRLGTDVYAKLRRPVEDYRRRQLVPESSRGKVAGGELGGRVAYVNDAIREIRASSPTGGYVVRRTGATPKPRLDANNPAAEPSVPLAGLAAAWELAEITPATPMGTATATATAQTLRDRLDPAKLRGLLTAIPELWAEQFLTGKKPAELGLEKPSRKLSIVRTNGQTLTLFIGNLSRAVKKEEPPLNPLNPRPPALSKPEEYYYAQLADNPLIFEIRGDRLADLFPSPDDLRDATIARFDAAEVQEVLITPPGGTPLTLLKKPGKKDAE
ncbi:MAG: DUF4340 domain-containing protein, partial [Gemmataceae bacterium]